MIGKWFSSYFGNDQETVDESDAASSDRRSGALEDLAIIYEKREDWHKAEETWRQVLTATPDRLRALLGLGSVLLKLGRTDDARDVYSRIGKRAATATIELDDLPAEDNDRQRAIWCMRRNRWHEALDCWKRLLHRYPNSLEVSLNIGQALVEIGELIEARTAFGDILESVPDRAGPWQLLLKLAMVERNWLLCDALYAHCLSLPEAGESILKTCLDYDLRRKKYQAAETLVLERFGQLDPVEVLMARIRLELSRSNLKKVLELTEQGEQRYPDRARRFRNRRSDCLAKMGRFEEAVRIVEKNITGGQAGTAATARYIRSCIEAGRIKKASRLINTIPEEWFDERTTSAAVAWNFVKQGEPTFARQAWDRVAFRPQLQSNKNLQSRLNRIRIPRQLEKGHNIRLISLVDESQISPHLFLEHYRRLGVEAFYLIDCGLSEQSLDYYLDQHDCAIFQPVSGRDDSCFGAYWVNYLGENYPGNGWDIFVGQNSFLVVPDIADVGIGLHLDLMDARDEEILAAVHLQMFPAVSADDLANSAAYPFDEVCRFDPRMRLHNTLYAPYLADIRQYDLAYDEPVFEQHVCAPVIRSGLNIRYLSGNRLTTPGTVSLLRGALLELQTGSGSRRGTLADQSLVLYEGLEKLEQMGLLSRVSPEQD